MSTARNKAHGLAKARAEAVKVADAEKQSNIVTDRLDTYFAALDQEQRRDAEPLIAEWLMSDDNAERWDGLMLVKHFGLNSLKPILHELDRKLARTASAGARFERERVAKVANSLPRL